MNLRSTINNCIGKSAAEEPVPSSIHRDRDCAYEWLSSHLYLNLDYLVFKLRSTAKNGDCWILAKMVQMIDEPFNDFCLLRQVVQCAFSIHHTFIVLLSDFQSIELHKNLDSRIARMWARTWFSFVSNMLRHRPQSMGKYEVLNISICNRWKFTAFPSTRSRISFFDHTETPKIEHFK